MKELKVMCVASLSVNIRSVVGPMNPLSITYYFFTPEQSVTVGKFKLHILCLENIVSHTQKRLKQAFFYSINEVTALIIFQVIRAILL